MEAEETLAPLDLAPPTKKLMVMKEVGATDRLFTHPGESSLQSFFEPGLPDGIIIQIWVNFGGSCNKRCLYII
jgi:hypothetical protein